MCYFEGETELFGNEFSGGAPKKSKFKINQYFPYTELEIVSDSFVLNITSHELDFTPVSDIATSSHADPDFSAFDQKLIAC